MTEPLSILDKIIESEKAKQLLSLDLEAEVDFLLTAPKIKKDREREVIRLRYGLTGEKPKTLEEIGKKLEITRERVRQIEKAALKKITEYSEKEKRSQKTLSLIHDLVKKDGKVVTFSRLCSLVLADYNENKKLVNELDFLTGLNKYFVQIHEGKEFKKSVAITELDLKEVSGTIIEAIKVLDDAKEPVKEKELVEKLTKTALDPEVVVAALSISKDIIKTEEGHLGLTSWREINPKSIRDKTYYILKKHQEPLHFENIAKHIEEINKGKKVTKQAVHNELIRDDRFVLIGRGIYALKEWGYKDGVVEEVIEEILTNAKEPMHKDEIIKEVLKRRMVKETTVLLNLQKGKFQRVARATYTLKNK